MTAEIAHLVVGLVTGSLVPLRRIRPEAREHSSTTLTHRSSGPDRVGTPLQRHGGVTVPHLSNPRAVHPYRVVTSDSRPRRRSRHPEFRCRSPVTPPRVCRESTETLARLFVLEGGSGVGPTANLESPLPRDRRRRSNEPFPSDTRWTTAPCGVRVASRRNGLAEVVEDVLCSLG